MSFHKPTPSLRGLSRALRRLPPSFGWDYRFAPSCAVQVIADIWGCDIYEIGATAGRMGLSKAQAFRIFSDAGLEVGKSAAEVTAEDVASVVDRIANEIAAA